MCSNTVKNIITNTEKLIKKCSPGGDIYGCAPKSAINKLKTLPFDRLLSMTTHLPKLENIKNLQLPNKSSKRLWLDPS